MHFIIPDFSVFIQYHKIFFCLSIEISDILRVKPKHELQYSIIRYQL